VTTGTAAAARARTTGRLAATALALATAVTLGAWGGPHDPLDRVDFVENCQNGGYASQAALQAFREARDRVAVDDARGARVAVAGDLPTLSPTLPPTLVIEAPELVQGASRPPRWAWARTLIDRARAPFAVRPAHATLCRPLTGEAFYLQVAPVDRPDPPAYAAVLTVRRYVPDAELWRQAALRLGQMVALTVLRARFEDGRLVEGPWRRSAVEVLRVAP
jgi:hypothetical protein